MKDRDMKYTPHAPTQDSGRIRWGAGFRLPQQTPSSIANRPDDKADAEVKTRTPRTEA